MPASPPNPANPPPVPPGPPGARGPVPHGQVPHGPPGAATPPPRPPAAAPRGRRLGPAVVLGAAALAVLLALVSVLISWRALDQANDARDIALSRAPGASGPAGPSQPAESSDPPPAPTGEPPGSGPHDPTVEPENPGFDEKTQYTVAYEKQDLTLERSCESSARRNIDLDEPRVNVGTNLNDLSFRSKCAGEAAATFLLPNEVVGASADAPSTTPNECARRIRTAPLGDDVPVPLQQGVVLCVVTSLPAANDIGISRKMVVVEVRAISEIRGSVVIRVSAWNIPA